MKNLKKVLAMVLVVAMVASFAVTASATSYAELTDVDTITYTTAVEALNSLGVIEGKSDGAFHPTDDVTRGQFAKMAAYVLNGGVDAATSYAASATTAFSDVASGKYYTAGIGYVVNKGLVDGFTDGTFRPDNSVTGVQAAKILLTALGYKSEYEGYTGSGWAQNVLTDAEDAHLFTGLESVDLTANLSREAAAQMIWNALQVQPVRYTGNGSVTVTTPDGTKVETAAPSSSPDYNYTSLADKVFGDDITPNSGTDDFGRPTTIYTLGVGGTQLATETATAVLTYTNKAVTGGTIYTDLGKPTVTTVNYALNGAESTTCPTVNTVRFDIASGNTAPVGGVGSVVEVYKTAAGVYTVVVIQTKTDTIATYTAATTNADGEITNPASVALTTAGESINTTAFTAADATAHTVVYYTYTVSGGQTTIQSVAAAPSFTGTLTSFKGNSYVISGTTYTGNEAVGFALTSGNAGTEAKFYLDGFNNLIATTAITVDAKYAVLTKFALVTESSNGAIGATSNSYLQAELVTFDGTSQIVTVDSLAITGGSTYTADGTNRNGNATVRVVTTEGDAGYLSTLKTTLLGARLDEPKVVTYTVDDDGIYTVTVPNQGVDLSGLTLAAKPAFVTGATANSKTQFIVRNGAGTPADPWTYTAYTGFSSLPTTAFDASSVAATGVAANGVATYVVVTGTDSTSNSGNTDVYYVTDNGTYNYVSSTEAYYEYNVIVNGAASTLKLNATYNVDGAAGTVVAGNVITVDTTNKKGYATNVLAQATDAITVEAANNIITLRADGVKAYDDNTVAYTIKNGEVTKTSIESMTQYYTAVYVTYVKDAAGRATDVIDTITAVYGVAP